MDREDLLNDLMATDFMATDLALYLDTHPKDSDVIEKYNCTIKEAAILRMQYEKKYGPLCSFRSLSPSEFFKWIESPWPWQNKNDR